MVREQQSIRNPLTPSQANIQQNVVKEKYDPADATFSAATTRTQLPDALDPTQPVFGLPTQLGVSTQRPSQPPSSRPAYTTGPRQPSSGRTDVHSNLFISAKSGKRPELHKPRAGINPLASLHRPLSAAANTSQPVSQQLQSEGLHKPKAQFRSTDEADSDDDDEEVFIIPKPDDFPSWRPKPMMPPTFSSFGSAAAAVKPSNAFISSGVHDIGMSTNAGLWDDRYAFSDPTTFIDAAQANEQLQALFEGGIEDEDDKPKKRRTKKRLAANVDQLSDEMGKINVTPGLDTTAKGLKVKEEEAQEEGEESEDDEDDCDDGTREGLKVKLLPHQIDGVKWMKRKEIGGNEGKGRTNGGILADDMGLGKTVQSIALILANPMPLKAKSNDESAKEEPKSDGATLVVAPLALIKQWESEIRDKVEDSHGLKVCIHHGPKRTKSFKDLRKFDVVITTYATLTSEHAASSEALPVGLYGINWYRIMLDEAHSIKNRNAKSTRAAYALKAQFRWCLTGTPMQNNLEELQSLIAFLQIAPLSKLNYWQDQIARPMSSGMGGLAIKRLQAVLRNIMKRRTKDILKQTGALRTDTKSKAPSNGSQGFKLVKRTVENIEAHFTARERDFYQRLESRTDQRLEMMMAGNKMSYASALVLLMRLRQACNHPRLIGSDLGAEKDSLTDGSQSPRKKAREDADDLATMLGGLRVGTQLCDVCQVELGDTEVRTGALRCIECERDVANQERVGNPKRRKSKLVQELVRTDRKAARRRIVIDSDDEDDERKESFSRSRIVDLDSDVDEHDDDGENNEEHDSSFDSDGDSADGAAADLVSSTKIRYLLSILRDDAHKHKYIVFSVFTSMLDLIEPFLRQSHIKFVRYDGSMRNDAREASLESLRHDPTVRVLLCSLRAGSLGLNLTAASRVVVLEPFWNPFVEEQAIDRVHRLNQTQDVVVYKMTIKDTVEARILELQEKKRALAEATVEGHKASGLGKLSMQEMLNLFQHGAERKAKIDMVGFRDLHGLLKDGDRTDVDDRGTSYAQDEIRRRDTERERSRKEARPRKEVPEAYSRRF